MRLSFLLAAMLVVPSQAQTRDAATTLGRDVVKAEPLRDAGMIVSPPTASAEADTTERNIGGLFVGAVNIEGARDIARSVFVPIIEPFVGKQASPDDLQAMARAIANAARGRGYIFASAVVPKQTVDTGTVTVVLDPGAVDRIRISGSDNATLRQVLAKIAGPAVRREVFERQILLAGDIPGISNVSTRYVRAPDGATLFVQVLEDKVSGSASLDNYGSRDLGPARARLEVDLTGLLDDSDLLVTQVSVTPLQPQELAFGSLRYTIGVGSAGTQIGGAVAAGATGPGGSAFAQKFTGQSRYGAIFVNHPVVRSARSNLWVNAELAYLSVDQRYENALAQQDEIATITLSMTANTKFAGSRLWGGFGAVQGFGGTQSGDAASSRPDGSSRFTKAVVWVNWAGTLTKQLSLRLAGYAQMASRPLLAAQEIGVGGPGFGRAYDFSERFGDHGALGLFELRQQFDKLLPGIDWVQTYQFADGGYVENMAGGYGDGARWSAGAGLRMARGKTSIGAELAFPLNARRSDDDSRAPRLNLTVGRNF